MHKAPLSLTLPIVEFIVDVCSSHDGDSFGASDESDAPSDAPVFLVETLFHVRSCFFCRKQ